jgi:hypothetical protein
MKDVKAHLERLRDQAAECAMLSTEAETKEKHKHFVKLCRELTAIADQAEANINGTAMSLRTAPDPQYHVLPKVARLIASLTVVLNVHRPIIHNKMTPAWLVQRRDHPRFRRGFAWGQNLAAAQCEQSAISTMR